MYLVVHDIKTLLINLYIGHIIYYIPSKRKKEKNRKETSTSQKKRKKRV